MAMTCDTRVLSSYSVSAFVCRGDVLITIFFYSIRFSPDPLM